MPIDSSIAMGYQPIKVENPMNSLAQLMQIQNAQSQNRLADLTFAQHQQDQENTNALNAAYASSVGADGKIDRTKLLQSLATSKLGSKIPTVQKSFLETDEAEGKVQKGKLELFDTAMKQRRDALAGVTSAEEYLAWHQGNHSDPILGPLLSARGVKPGDALAQVEAALKQPDGLKNLITQSAFGMTKFAELNKPSFQNVNSGKVSTLYAVPGMGGAPSVVNTTQMTTTPGEDLRSQDAAKTRAQAERHFKITQASKNADSVKMTEDQGKATGWLVQAENAFKNMMEVGKDKDGNPTSAARPGFNDALASIPSFGLTTAVANSFRGADRQKFMQASSSLSEALLRAATGAGVNKDEAAQKIAELTPQFGEDDETTKQKYAAIPLYIESLKVRAGPGAKKAATVLEGTQSGFKYLGTE